MECTIIPYSLFDNGGIECRTFVHAYNDSEGNECSDIYSWETLERLCMEEKGVFKRKYLEYIKSIVANNGHYLGLDDGISEIQWD